MLNGYGDSNIPPNGNHKHSQVPPPPKPSMSMYPSAAGGTWQTGEELYRYYEDFHNQQQHHQQQQQHPQQRVDISAKPAGERCRNVCCQPPCVEQRYSLNTPLPPHSTLRFSTRPQYPMSMAANYMESPFNKKEISFEDFIPKLSPPGTGLTQHQQYMSTTSHKSSMKVSPQYPSFPVSREPMGIRPPPPYYMSPPDVTKNNMYNPLYSNSRTLRNSTDRRSKWETCSYNEYPRQVPYPTSNTIPSSSQFNSSHLYPPYSPSFPLQPPPSILNGSNYPMNVTMPGYGCNYTVPPAPPFPAAVTPTESVNKKPPDKKLDIDVREYLATWDDDVDDDTSVKPSDPEPMVVLDCTSLEGDGLAQVREKLKGRSVQVVPSNLNDSKLPYDLGGATIVQVQNSDVLPKDNSKPYQALDFTKAINEMPTEDVAKKAEFDALISYQDGSKKDDSAYDLVEMTECLVAASNKISHPTKVSNEQLPETKSLEVHKSPMNLMDDPEQFIMPSIIHKSVFKMNSLHSESTSDLSIKERTLPELDNQKEVTSEQPSEPSVCNKSEVSDTCSKMILTSPNRAISSLDNSSKPLIHPAYSVTSSMTSNYCIKSSMSSSMYPTKPEMSSNYSSNPVMSSEYSNKPIMSSEFINKSGVATDYSTKPEMVNYCSQPIIASNYSTKVTMSSDYARKSIMSSDYLNNPFLPSSYTSKAIMSNFSHMHSMASNYANKPPISSDYVSKTEIDYSTRHFMSSGYSPKSAFSLGFDNKVMTSDHSNLPPMSSSDLTNRPLMSSDHSSRPVMSSGYSAKPVVSLGYDNKVMTSDHSNLSPMSSSDLTNRPLMSSDHSSRPVMSSGYSAEPLVSLGYDNKVMTSDHSHLPPMSSSNLTNRPLMSSDHSSRPVMSSGYSAEPLVSLGYDNKVMTSDHSNLPPMSSPALTNRLPMSSDHSNIPSMSSGYSAKPALSLGYDNKVMTSDHSNLSPLSSSDLSNRLRMSSDHSNRPSISSGYSAEPVLSLGYDSKVMTPDQSNIPPMSSPDHSNRPLMSSGYSADSTLSLGFESKVMPSDQSNRPIVSSEYSTKPAMSSDSTVTPRMTSAYSSNKHKMSSDYTKKCIMSSDYTKKSIMLSDDTTKSAISSDYRPVISSDYSSKPVMSSDNPTKALMSSDYSTKPVIPSNYSSKPTTPADYLTKIVTSSDTAIKLSTFSDFTSKPIISSDQRAKSIMSSSNFSTKSVMSSEYTTKPVMSSDHTSKPIPTDYPTKPVMSALYGTKPIMSLDFTAKPTMSSDNNVKPVMTPDTAKLAMSDDFNKPLVSLDDPTKTRMPADDTSKPNVSSDFCGKSIVSNTTEYCSSKPVDTIDYCSRTISQELDTSQYFKKRKWYHSYCNDNQETPVTNNSQFNDTNYFFDKRFEASCPPVPCLWESAAVDVKTLQSKTSDLNLSSNVFSPNRVSFSQDSDHLKSFTKDYLTEQNKILTQNVQISPIKGNPLMSSSVSYAQIVENGILKNAPVEDNNLVSEDKRTTICDSDYNICRNPVTKVEKIKDENKNSFDPLLSSARRSSYNTDELEENEKESVLKDCETDDTPGDYISDGIGKEEDSLSLFCENSFERDPINDYKDTTDIVPSKLSMKCDNHVVINNIKVSTCYKTKKIKESKKMTQEKKENITKMRDFRKKKPCALKQEEDKNQITEEVRKPIKITVQKTQVRVKSKENQIKYKTQFKLKTPKDNSEIEKKDSTNYSKKRKEIQAIVVKQDIKKTVKKFKIVKKPRPAVREETTCEKLRKCKFKLMKPIVSETPVLHKITTAQIYDFVGSDEDKKTQLKKPAEILPCEFNREKKENDHESRSSQMLNIELDEICDSSKLASSAEHLISIKSEIVSVSSLCTSISSDDSRSNTFLPNEKSLDSYEGEIKHSVTVCPVRNSPHLNTFNTQKLFDNAPLGNTKTREEYFENQKLSQNFQEVEENLRRLHGESSAQRTLFSSNEINAWTAHKLNSFQRTDFKDVNTLFCNNSQKPVFNYQEETEYSSLSNQRLNVKFENKPNCVFNDSSYSTGKYLQNTGASFYRKSESNENCSLSLLNAPRFEAVKQQGLMHVLNTDHGEKVNEFSSYGEGVKEALPCNLNFGETPFLKADSNLTRHSNDLHAYDKQIGIRSSFNDLQYSSSEAKSDLNKTHVQETFGSQDVSTAFENKLVVSEGNNCFNIDITKQEKQSNIHLSKCINLQSKILEIKEECFKSRQADDDESKIINDNSCLEEKHNDSISKEQNISNNRCKQNDLIESQSLCQVEYSSKSADCFENFDGNDKSSEHYLDYFVSDCSDSEEKTIVSCHLSKEIEGRRNSFDPSSNDVETANFENTTKRDMLDVEKSIVITSETIPDQLQDSKKLVKEPSSNENTHSYKKSPSRNPRDSIQDGRDVLLSQLNQKLEYETCSKPEEPSHFAGPNEKSEIISGTKMSLVPELKTKYLIDIDLHQSSYESHNLNVSQNNNNNNDEKFVVEIDKTDKPLRPTDDHDLLNDSSLNLGTNSRKENHSSTDINADNQFDGSINNQTDERPKHCEVSKKYTNNDELNEKYCNELTEDKNEGGTQRDSVIQSANESPNIIENFTTKLQNLKIETSFTPNDITSSENPTEKSNQEPSSQEKVEINNPSVIYPKENVSNRLNPTGTDLGEQESIEHVLNSKIENIPYNEEISNDIHKSNKIFAPISLAEAKTSTKTSDLEYSQREKTNDSYGTDDAILVEKNSKKNAPHTILKTDFIDDEIRSETPVSILDKKNADKTIEHLTLSKIDSEHIEQNREESLHENIIETKSGCLNKEDRNIVYETNIIIEKMLNETEVKSKVKPKEEKFSDEIIIISNNSNILSLENLEIKLNTTKTSLDDSIQIIKNSNIENSLTRENDEKNNQEHSESVNESIEGNIAQNISNKTEVVFKKIKLKTLDNDDNQINNDHKTNFENISKVNITENNTNPSEIIPDDVRLNKEHTGIENINTSESENIEDDFDNNKPQRSPSTSSFDKADISNSDGVNVDITNNDHSTEKISSASELCKIKVNAKHSVLGKKRRKSNDITISKKDALLNSEHIHTDNHPVEMNLDQTEVHLEDTEFDRNKSITGSETSSKSGVNNNMKHISTLDQNIEKDTVQSLFNRTEVHINDTRPGGSKSTVERGTSSKSEAYRLEKGNVSNKALSNSKEKQPIIAYDSTILKNGDNTLIEVTSIRQCSCDKNFVSGKKKNEHSRKNKGNEVNSCLPKDMGREILCSGNVLKFKKTKGEYDIPNKITTHDERNQSTSNKSINKTNKGLRHKTFIIRRTEDQERHEIQSKNDELTRTSGQIPCNVNDNSSALPQLLSSSKITTAVNVYNYICINFDKDREKLGYDNIDKIIEKEEVKKPIITVYRYNKEFEENNILMNYKSQSKVSSSNETKSKQTTHNQNSHTNVIKPVICNLDPISRNLVEPVFKSRVCRNNNSTFPHNNEEALRKNHLVRTYERTKPVKKKTILDINKTNRSCDNIKESKLAKERCTSQIDYVFEKDFACNESTGDFFFKDQNLYDSSVKENDVNDEIEASKLLEKIMNIKSSTKDEVITTTISGIIVKDEVSNFVKIISDKNSGENNLIAKNTQKIITTNNIVSNKVVKEIARSEFFKTSEKVNNLIVPSNVQGEIKDNNSKTVKKVKINSSAIKNNETKDFKTVGDVNNSIVVTLDKTENNFNIDPASFKKIAESEIYTSIEKIDNVSQIVPSRTIENPHTEVLKTNQNSQDNSVLMKMPDISKTVCSKMIHDVVLNEISEEIEVEPSKEMVNSNNSIVSNVDSNCTKTEVADMIHDMIKNIVLSECSITKEDSNGNIKDTKVPRETEECNVDAIHENVVSVVLESNTEVEIMKVNIHHDVGVASNLIDDSRQIVKENKDSVVKNNIQDEIMNLEICREVDHGNITMDIVTTSVEVAVAYRKSEYPVKNVTNVVPETKEEVINTDSRALENDKYHKKLEKKEDITDSKKTEKENDGVTNSASKETVLKAAASIISKNNSIESFKLLKPVNNIVSEAITDFETAERENFSFDVEHTLQEKSVTPSVNKSEDEGCKTNFDTKEANIDTEIKCRKMCRSKEIIHSDDQIMRSFSTVEIELLQKNLEVNPNSNTESSPSFFDKQPEIYSSMIDKVGSKNSTPVENENNDMSKSSKESQENGPNSDHIFDQHIAGTESLMIEGITLCKEKQSDSLNIDLNKRFESSGLPSYEIKADENRLSKLKAHETCNKLLLEKFGGKFTNTIVSKNGENNNDMNEPSSITTKKTSSLTISNSNFDINTINDTGLLYFETTFLTNCEEIPLPPQTLPPLPYEKIYLPPPPPPPFGNYLKNEGENCSKSELNVKDFSFLASENQKSKISDFKSACDNNSLSLKTDILSMKKNNDSNKRKQFLKMKSIIRFENLKRQFVSKPMSTCESKTLINTKKPKVWQMEPSNSKLDNVGVNNCLVESAIIDLFSSNEKTDNFNTVTLPNYDVILSNNSQPPSLYPDVFTTEKNPLFTTNLKVGNTNCDTHVLNTIATSRLGKDNEDLIRKRKHSDSNKILQKIDDVSCKHDAPTKRQSEKCSSFKHGYRQYSKESISEHSHYYRDENPRTKSKSDSANKYERERNQAIAHSNEKRTKSSGSELSRKDIYRYENSEYRKYQMQKDTGKYLNQERSESMKSSKTNQENTNFVDQSPSPSASTFSLNEITSEKDCSPYSVRSEDISFEDVFNPQDFVIIDSWSDSEETVDNNALLAPFCDKEDSVVILNDDTHSASVNSRTKETPLVEYNLASDQLNNRSEVGKFKVETSPLDNPEKKVVDKEDHPPYIDANSVRNEENSINDKVLKQPKISSENVADSSYNTAFASEDPVAPSHLINSIVRGEIEEVSTDLPNIPNKKSCSRKGDYVSESEDTTLTVETSKQKNHIEMCDAFLEAERKSSPINQRTLVRVDGDFKKSNSISINKIIPDKELCNEINEFENFKNSSVMEDISAKYHATVVLTEAVEKNDNTQTAEEVILTPKNDVHSRPPELETTCPNNDSAVSDDAIQYDRFLTVRNDPINDEISNVECNNHCSIETPNDNFEKQQEASQDHINIDTIETPPVLHTTDEPISSYDNEDNASGNGILNDSVSNAEQPNVSNIEPDSVLSNTSIVNSKPKCKTLEEPERTKESYVVVESQDQSKMAKTTLEKIETKKKNSNSKLSKYKDFLAARKEKRRSLTKGISKADAEIISSHVDLTYGLRERKPVLAETKKPEVPDTCDNRRTSLRSNFNLNKKQIDDKLEERPLVNERKRKPDNVKIHNSKKSKIEVQSQQVASTDNSIRKDEEMVVESNDVTTSLETVKVSESESNMCTVITKGDTIYIKLKSNSDDIAIVDTDCYVLINNDPLALLAQETPVVILDGTNEHIQIENSFEPQNPKMQSNKTESPPTLEPFWNEEKARQEKIKSIPVLKAEQNSKLNIKKLNITPMELHLSKRKQSDDTCSKKSDIDLSNKDKPNETQDAESKLKTSKYKLSHKTKSLEPKETNNKCKTNESSVSKTVTCSAVNQRQKILASKEEKSKSKATCTTSHSQQKRKDKHDLESDFKENRLLQKKKSDKFTSENTHTNNVTEAMEISESPQVKRRLKIIKNKRKLLKSFDEDENMNKVVKTEDSNNSDNVIQKSLTKVSSNATDMKKYDQKETSLDRKKSSDGNEQNELQHDVQKPSVDIKRKIKKGSTDKSPKVTERTHSISENSNKKVKRKEQNDLRKLGTLGDNVSKIKTIKSCNSKHSQNKHSKILNNQHPSSSKISIEKIVESKKNSKSISSLKRKLIELDANLSLFKSEDKDLKGIKRITKNPLIKSSADMSSIEKNSNIKGHNDRKAKIYTVSQDKLMPHKDRVQQEPVQDVDAEKILEELVSATLKPLATTLIGTNNKKADKNLKLYIKENEVILPGIKEREVMEDVNDSKMTGNSNESVIIVCNNSHENEVLESIEKKDSGNIPRSCSNISNNSNEEKAKSLDDPKLMCVTDNVNESVNIVSNNSHENEVLESIEKKDIGHSPLSGSNISNNSNEKEAKSLDDPDNVNESVNIVCNNAHENGVFEFTEKKDSGHVSTSDSNIRKNSTDEETKSLDEDVCENNTIPVQNTSTDSKKNELENHVLDPEHDSSAEVDLDEPVNSKMSPRAQIPSDTTLNDQSECPPSVDSENHTDKSSMHSNDVALNKIEDPFAILIKEVNRELENSYSYSRKITSFKSKSQGLTLSLRNDVIKGEFDIGQKDFFDEMQCEEEVENLLLCDSPVTNNAPEPRELSPFSERLLKANNENPFDTDETEQFDHEEFHLLRKHPPWQIRDTSPTKHTPSPTIFGDTKPFNCRPVLKNTLLEQELRDSHSLKNFSPDLVVGQTTQNVELEVQSHEGFDSSISLKENYLTTFGLKCQKKGVESALCLNESPARDINLLNCAELTATSGLPSFSEIALNLPRSKILSFERNPHSPELSVDFTFPRETEKDSSEYTNNAVLPIEKGGNFSSNDIKNQKPTSPCTVPSNNISKKNPAISLMGRQEKDALNGQDEDTICNVDKETSFSVSIDGMGASDDITVTNSDSSDKLVTIELNKFNINIEDKHVETDSTRVEIEKKDTSRDDNLLNGESKDVANDDTDKIVDKTVESNDHTIDDIGLNVGNTNSSNYDIAVNVENRVDVANDEIIVFNVDNQYNVCNDDTVFIEDTLVLESNEIRGKEFDEGVEGEKFVVTSRVEYSDSVISSRLGNSPIGISSRLGQSPTVKGQVLEEDEMLTSSILDWPHLEEEVITQDDQEKSNGVAETSELKIKLPWSRIFDLEKDECAVEEQKSLELGPVEIKLQLNSFETSCLKVKRLILQKAHSESSDRDAHDEIKADQPQVALRREDLLEEMMECQVLSVKLGDVVTCDFCGRKLLSQDFLSRHMRHLHELHTCHVCDQTFPGELLLLSHTSCHKEQHHCLLCNKVFTTADKFRQHEESSNHRQLESVQRQTIHILYKFLSGRDCTALEPLTPEEIARLKWTPSEGGDAVHVYHPTPLHHVLQGNFEIESSAANACSCGKDDCVGNNCADLS